MLAVCLLLLIQALLLALSLPPTLLMLALSLRTWMLMSALAASAVETAALRPCVRASWRAMGW